MKKYLLLLCALVCGTLAFAQTTPGTVVHECAADIADWSINPASPTYGDFHLNTWSTEDDASGMKQPFLEYWVGDGNTLSAATISHETLTGLTPGYYEVSMDIRIFSETGATIGKGTTFNANGASEDLDDTTIDGNEDVFGTETEVYGTYHLLAQVTEAAGTLDISLSIPEGATYNWISFKNLKVEFISQELTYNIGEPQCSATTVQPGSELTITFDECTTPDTDETPVLDSNKSITVNGEAVEATLTTTGLTATVTITIPETLSAGETVEVVVPAGLLYWENANPTVSSPTSNVTFTLIIPAPVIDSQSGVYLYNTHADQFLSRGGEYTDVTTYGKIAATDPYGIPVDITIGDDGLATVKYLDSNLYLYLEGWAYTDGGTPAKYAVKEVTTDDGETVYQFCYEDREDTYLYVNDETHNFVASNGNLDGDNNLQGDITRTYWKIYTMVERDAHKEASIVADHIAVAAAAGVTLSSEDAFQSYLEGLDEADLTSMVTNAALAGNLSGWTQTGYYTDNDGTYFSTGTWGTEIYQGDAKLVQTVSDLKEGIYKVTLQGFVRDGYADNIVNSGLSEYDLSIGFIGANGYQTNLKPWASEADLDARTPDGTGNAFTNRTYPNELYTYVGEDGTLELSINCPDVLYGGWMIFKNLTLTQYAGEEFEYTNDVTWALANPSFETDKVANLAEDETRSTTEGDNPTYTGGAYTIGNGLTGWDLVPPSQSSSNNSAYATSDLMTEACKRTDNAFGAPGTPTNGTQMLYLREGHTNWSGAGTSASVKQTVTLPAGDYKVTVDSKCVATATAEHSVNLVAGEKNKSISIGSTSMPEDWTTTSLTFTLTEDAVVTLGVDIAYDSSTDDCLSVLLDNFKLYSVDAIEKEISWTMTEAGWGTMILPFSATLDEGLTAYSCDGTEDTTDEDGNVTTVVSLEEVGQSIEANTPYIVSGTAGTYTFTDTPTNTVEIYSEGIITGTLVDLAIEKGAALTIDGTNYVLQNHDEEGGEGLAFYPITSESTGVTLDAYHCYLDLSLVTTSARPVALHFPGAGETTAIVAVESDDLIANDAIYDLSGRRVAKAVKGVYIQNGKKVLVK